MIKLPDHIILSIEHNEHKTCYQTVSEFVETHEWMKDCISKEDLQICIERDDLWSISWYPITPISFEIVMSYSLERCFEMISSGNK